MTRPQRRRPLSSEREFEAALARADNRPFVLRLYISGTTARAARAVANIKRVCDRELPGRYDLEVIDIFQQIQKARRAQILASPTLIKKLPLPLRRIIGDMSDEKKLLKALDLRAPDA